MGELRTIETTAKGFETDKHKYVIINTLPIERYIMYLKMQTEIAFDVSFSGVYNAFSAIIGKLNESKPVEAGIIANNAQIGLSQLDTKRLPVLTMCSLFIIREDEDVREFSETVMDEKIDDWTKSGIEIGFFLNFAEKLIHGYEQFSKIASLNTLNTVKKAEQESSKKR